MPAKEERMPVCKKCHQHLPREAFDSYPRRGKNSTNLHNRCRQCRSEIAAKKGEPRFDVDEQTGCWNWRGAKNSKGYSNMRHNGGTKSAARVFYERIRGPIPDGLELDHVACNNRGCVNPWHVEPSTHLANVRRAAHVKLDEELAEVIRAMAPTFSSPVLAKMFRVNPVTIQRVVSKETWR
jgi:hypothetical protein